jgi:hypothetical protein
MPKRREPRPSTASAAGCAHESDVAPSNTTRFLQKKPESVAFHFSISIVFEHRVWNSTFCLVDPDSKRTLAMSREPKRPRLL